MPPHVVGQRARTVVAAVGEKDRPRGGQNFAALTVKFGASLSVCHSWRSRIFLALERWFSASSSMRIGSVMPQIQQYVIFLLIMAGIDGSTPHSSHVGHNSIHEQGLWPATLQDRLSNCADGYHRPRLRCYNFFDGGKSSSDDQRNLVMGWSCCIHGTKICGLLRTKPLCLRGAGETDDAEMEVDEEHSELGDVNQKPATQDLQQSDSFMVETTSQAAARVAEAAVMYEQLLQKSQVSMEDREHQESTRMADEENVEAAVFDAEGAGVSKDWSMLTALDTFGVNVTVFQLRTPPYILVEVWWDSMGMFRCSYEVREMHCYCLGYMNFTHLCVLQGALCRVYVCIFV